MNSPTNTYDPLRSRHRHPLRAPQTFLDRLRGEEARTLQNLQNSSQWTNPPRTQRSPDPNPNILFHNAIAVMAGGIPPPRSEIPVPAGGEESARIGIFDLPQKTRGGEPQIWKLYLQLLVSFLLGMWLYFNVQRTLDYVVSAAVLGWGIWVTVHVYTSLCCVDPGRHDPVEQVRHEEGVRVERERVERVRVELGEEGPRKEPVVKPRHQGSLFDVPRFMPRGQRNPPWTAPRQQNHVQVEKHVHFAPTKKATYDPKMGPKRRPQDMPRSYHDAFPGS